MRLISDFLHPIANWTRGPTIQSDLGIVGLSNRIERPLRQRRLVPVLGLRASRHHRLSWEVWRVPAQELVPDSVLVLEQALTASMVQAVVKVPMVYPACWGLPGWN